MKLLNKKFAILMCIILLLTVNHAFPQDATKGQLSIAVNYFLYNNTVPYVMVKVKTKTDGRFKPVTDIPLKLFLNKASAGTLIGEIVTDDNGQASEIIPSSLKNEWSSSAQHTFIATFAGNKKYDSSEADVTVGRAKILIDTTSDKKITATVLGLQDTSWVPLKNVDVIIAIKRMDANLSVNENATFTTDSTGQATADFKRDSIPGDARGNLVLIAKVEDNDQYGNFSVEKTVPWGAEFIPVNNFDKRTLFATRNKAPVWLLLIAYSIVISVWSILLFLVINIFRIKKLGREV